MVYAHNCFTIYSKHICQCLSIFRIWSKGMLIRAVVLFINLLLGETWVKLACVAWRSKFARSCPNLRPRPQGFSLKKWVGHPRGFSALARLYYLATKTAMLRRLGSSLFVFYWVVSRFYIKLINKLYIEITGAETRDLRSDKVRLMHEVRRKSCEHKWCI